MLRLCFADFSKFFTHYPIVEAWDIEKIISSRTIIFYYGWEFAPAAGTNEGTPRIISGHSGLTTPDPVTSVTLCVCIHGYLCAAQIWSNRS